MMKIKPSTLNRIKQSGQSRKKTDEIISLVEKLPLNVPLALTAQSILREIGTDSRRIKKIAQDMLKAAKIAEEMGVNDPPQPEDMMTTRQKQAFFKTMSAEELSQSIRSRRRYLSPEMYEHYLQTKKMLIKCLLGKGDPEAAIDFLKSTEIPKRKAEAFAKKIYEHRNPGLSYDEKPPFTRELLEKEFAQWKRGTDDWEDAMERERLKRCFPDFFR